MTLLQIRIWPDPALRLVATPVADFGSTFQQLVDDMAETMYAAKGVGLAATQVGVAQRVFVMDASPDGTKLEVLVNHQILSSQEKKVLQPAEGCLSFPGVYEAIPRFGGVKGTALDREGVPFMFDYTGLAAQCVQHEGEHLDGKVMLDHLSRQRRRFVEREMAKRKK